MHPVPDAPASGVIEPRLGTVRIGFMIAAREGDPILCATGGSGGVILRGEPTVRIEGKPAARMSDPVSHLKDPITHLGIPCGEVELGCPTVNIGSMAQAQALLAGAREGVPFCAKCEERAFRPPLTEGAARQADVLRKAAKSGTPFCEACEKGGES
jgi:uncharacterized Zn-binding protein involved in type VI secretion